MTALFHHLFFAELYNRFRLVDIKVAGSSITIQWEWGTHADRNVRIKLSGYVGYERAWRRPVILQPVSKLRIELLGDLILWGKLKKKRKNSKEHGLNEIVRPGFFTVVVVFSIFGNSRLNFH